MTFFQGKTFQKWVDELTVAWEHAIVVLDSLQAHVVAQAASSFLKSVQTDIFPLIKNDQDVADLWDLLNGLKRIVLTSFDGNKGLARIYVHELWVWCPPSDAKKLPMIKSLCTFVTAHEQSLFSAVQKQKPVEVSLPGF